MTVDLTEARRLEAAATPGPWTGRGPRIYYAQGQEVLAESDMLNRNHGLLRVETTGRARSWAADAALIAHLRNHATDYFDAVEQRDQLREALERLLGALDGATHGLFEEWPATQGAVQAEGILIADLEPEISIADAVLARLREPEQQGSGDEEGEL